MKKETAAAQVSHPRTSNFPNTNSSGVASVVLGILGMLLPALYGIVLGIAAFVFGIVQHRVAASRWSIAGIILGLLSIVFGILGFVYAPVLSAEAFGGIA